MYHRVTPDPPAHDPFGNFVSVATFESHLKWLRRRGYQGVDLGAVRRLVDPTADSAGLPSRPIAITFDDGYGDNYEHALPLLERYGFTATIFVVTGAIGGTNSFDGPNVPPARMLSGKEILQLRARGICLGSHTHTHPQSLTSLSENEVRFELSHSRAVLSDLLQEDIDHFAYPHSVVDRRVETEVSRAGYRTACAGRGTRFSAHCLPRVPANSKTGLELELYGAWRRLKWRIQEARASGAGQQGTT